MVKLLLTSLSKELMDLETKLIVLGDVHANIEQEFEQIVGEAIQVLVLRTKMTLATKAI